MQFTYDPPSFEESEEPGVDVVAARLAAEPAHFLAALKSTKRARTATVETVSAPAPIVAATEDDGSDGSEDLSSSTVRWPGASDAEAGQELGFMRSDYD